MIERRRLQGLEDLRALQELAAEGLDITPLLSNGHHPVDNRPITRRERKALKREGMNLQGVTKVRQTK